MLLLRKLRYKNFLSAGNNFTEIDFTASESSLIIGENGAGKSTVNDALSYALFNKAHRNINKPALINSINNKNCVVEVEFSVGQFNYVVKRGMKPTMFEIWKGDELINQDSHSKEYQKFLEQNILKLNHKSFHQVVVLGSSSFVPFMQLPSGQRREVIEDLLDISVFSRMNILAKEKSAKLKDSLNTIDYEITLVENRIEGVEQNIANIESVNNQMKVKTQAKIEELEFEVKKEEAKEAEHQSTFDTLSENIKKTEAKLSKRLRELGKVETKMQSELASVGKATSFYMNSAECPTCSQEIAEDIKDTKIKECDTRKEELTTAIKLLKEELSKLNDEAFKLNKEKLEAEDLGKLISQHKSNVLAATREITSLTKSITETAGVQELEDSRQALQAHRDELQEKRTEKHGLEEKAAYQRVIMEMLKDSGIKTKIIKEYIPVINKLVNTYLEALDFYVKFELDDTFKEVIKSRHRDEFTYDSFSEGEKTKIDVALLFAWRHIAQMKNSLSTNLLVLDETFDSSLDNDGIENLMNLIRTFKEQTNIFVISHKQELHDRFDQTLKFRKENNFSTYEVV